MRTHEHFTIQERSRRAAEAKTETVSVSEILGEKSRTFYRWAITTDSHGLIGPGWLRPEPEYPYLLPVALFRTRREAREARARVWGPAARGRYSDARVVRVSVLIQVEE